MAAIGEKVIQQSEVQSLPSHARQRVKLEKVTLYVRPEQVLQLEEVQLQERRRTGRRPDKSDLVQEALDLLFQRYSATEHA
jgi:hypothetical protein